MVSQLFTGSFLTFLITIVISSPNKHHHPDIDLNVLQMIEKYGYPIERHRLETEDGYILEMHRIPHGIKQKNYIKKGPVLLVHGVSCSSVDWVLLGPETSLSYILADEGYDVWIGNARGNTWSCNHTILDPHKNKKEFWSFSWHEIGYFDLPAMIDYTLRVNGENKLQYIGHSQGVTAAFVLLSERPEYNTKIRLMHAFAPPVYFNHTYSPLVRLLTKIQDTLWFYTKAVGMYELKPNKELLNLVGVNFCSIFAAKELCSNALFLLGGFDKEQLNMTLLPVILKNTGGCALRQFIHYLQNIRSGLFRKFDFCSPFKNFEYYGQEEPPEYNLEAATVPVILYYAQNDWLVAMKDVVRLSKELPNVIELKFIEYEHFNHFDYLWAQDVRKLLYNYVIELMDKY